MKPTWLIRRKIKVGCNYAWNKIIQVLKVRNEMWFLGCDYKCQNLFIFIFLSFNDFSSIQLFRILFVYIYIIKFSPNRAVETAETRQTPFRAHLTPGFGVWGRIPATNLSPLRSIPMPNFIEIGPVVWISIQDTHTHTHTLINFYMFDILYNII